MLHWLSTMWRNTPRLILTCYKIHSLYLPGFVMVLNVVIGKKPRASRGLPRIDRAGRAALKRMMVPKDDPTEV